MNPATYLRGIIVERRIVTSGLWIIRVRPEEKLSFEPGQYVTIGLPSGARMIERPYSLVSASSEEQLEFFLELVPGGTLTPVLYELTVGAEIFLRRAAKGRFKFDARSAQVKHLMIATVTGVAPFVSMLREIARTWGDRRPPFSVSSYMAQALPRSSAMGTSSPPVHANGSGFGMFPVSAGLGWKPGGQERFGRVDDIVRKYADVLGFTPPCTTAYLCGNPEMIVGVRSILQRSGFSRDSIREEMYWPAP